MNKVQQIAMSQADLFKQGVDVQLCIAEEIVTIDSPFTRGLEDRPLSPSSTASVMLLTRLTLSI